MNLTYRENYWNSPELKKEFMSFLVRIFGLDLSLWDNKGFWDRRYRPFSYFDNGTLVSNVCVYSMNMTIRGKQCLVAQISAVGTLPEYRRKGLSFRLTQQAMAWARDNHDFFFLFADEAAYRFYEECGFRRTDEYKARISAPQSVARPGAVRLDMQRTDHIKQVYRLASERCPVSDVLGVTNDKLFMYWCLYTLRDHIHYISELDTLVLCKRDGGLLTVFDILGQRVPAFAEIYSYICDPGDETIEFLFMVDKQDLGDHDLVRVEGNGTHLLGKFPLESTQFIFPFTSHA
jgi:GNAT superfamily N-acetyltransferase